MIHYDRATIIKYIHDTAMSLLPSYVLLSLVLLLSMSAIVLFSRSKLSRPVFYWALLGALVVSTFVNATCLYLGVKDVRNISNEVVLDCVEHECIFSPAMHLKESKFVARGPLTLWVVKKNFGGSNVQLGSALHSSVINEIYDEDDIIDGRRPFHIVGAMAHKPYDDPMSYTARLGYKTSQGAEHLVDVPMALVILGAQKTP